MTKLKIRTYPDPILKQKAQPWTDFGPEAQKFFDDMIEIMFIEDGVGLAAPQVGVSKQVLIAAPTGRKGEEYVVINPEIYESHGEEMGVEGCLSFPGVAGEVARAKRIKVRYQDRHGKKMDVELKDFFARVIQHEMDHLNGVLLVDRIRFDRRQEFLAQYQKL